MSSRDNDGCWVAICIAFILLILVAGNISKSDKIKEKEAELQAFKKAAVEHGVARWETDADGKVSFFWNPRAQPIPAEAPTIKP